MKNLFELDQMAYHPNVVSLNNYNTKKEDQIDPLSIALALLQFLKLITQPKTW